jgi:ketosteroid isomerase-like protein
MTQLRHSTPPAVTINALAVPLSAKRESQRSSRLTRGAAVRSDRLGRDTVPVSQENVEIVRRSYAAFNRVIVSGDIAPFLLEFYDPGIEYKPVEEESAVQGHEQFGEYCRRFYDVWEEFRWELEEVIDAGDSIVSEALLKGRARASGIEITQRLFLVADVRGSKIVRLREYLDRQEALEAAGLSE